MHLVAVSGSPRTGSLSTNVLRAVLALAPEGDTTALYTGIHDLPHFAPDADIRSFGTNELASVAVQTLRDALTGADAVLFCTPEYAHGMPGSLKNALDWLVGSGEMIGKPVMTLSASPSVDGGSYAHAALVQTLTVMSANVVPEASFSVGLARTRFGADGTITDAGLADTLRAGLAALRAAALVAS